VTTVILFSVVNLLKLRYNIGKLRFDEGNKRMDTLLKRIDEYKSLIDSRRPLKPEEIKELDNYFRIGTTYSSNALEGNTLTLIGYAIIT